MVGQSISESLMMYLQMTRPDRRNGKDSCAPLTDLSKCFEGLDWIKEKGAEMAAVPLDESVVSCMRAALSRSTSSLRPD